MSRPWLRRLLRWGWDVGFWIVLADIFLVALVMAIGDGDRWRIGIAAMWLMSSTVQLVRSLRSRRERQHQGSDSPR